MHVHGPNAVCDMSVVVAEIWAQMDPSSAKSACNARLGSTIKYARSHTPLVLTVPLNLLDRVLCTPVSAIPTLAADD